MDKNEYLVARVGHLKLGVYCRDIKHVYAERLRLVRVFDQGSIFRGIVQVGNTLMPVIDLRRRIGLPDHEPSEVLTLICFQTNLSDNLAVVVDEIEGMKYIDSSNLIPHHENLGNQRQNINLLFPLVALLEEGEMIHLLDSTYLDKTEPIEETAGDLEMF